MKTCQETLINTKQKNDGLILHSHIFLTYSYHCWGQILCIFFSGTFGGLSIFYSWKPAHFFVLYWFQCFKTCIFPPEFYFWQCWEGFETAKEKGKALFHNVVDSQSFPRMFLGRKNMSSGNNYGQHWDKVLSYFYKLILFLLKQMLHLNKTYRKCNWETVLPIKTTASVVSANVRCVLTFKWQRPLAAVGIMKAPAYFNGGACWMVKQRLKPPETNNPTVTPTSRRDWTSQTLFF